MEFFDVIIGGRYALRTSEDGAVLRARVTRRSDERTSFMVRWETGPQTGTETSVAGSALTRTWSDYKTNG
jgi:hypothetical protein